jgi:hypothetical protein
MATGYIPQKDRKKILLLCDDLRMHSGIATMAREFVTGLAHRYNWVQIAGSVQHPEKGKIMNLDVATNAVRGINDAYVRLYPVDGYGDPNLLNEVIKIENPNAILHFTDPRFWIWLYQIERETRQKLPLGFILFGTIFHTQCTTAHTTRVATGSVASVSKRKILSRVFLGRL